MTWILIYIVARSYGITTANVEFNSQQTCVEAAAQVNKAASIFTDVRAVCVKK